MLFQAPPPPPPPVFTQVGELPAASFWNSMPPEGIAIIALAIVVGAVIVLFPLMRALARRLEGKAAVDPGLTAELEQLRLRVAELEQVPHQVAELEERLDFAERLLGQQRDAGRLERGSS